MTWSFQIPVPAPSDRINLLTIRQVTRAISDPTERATSAHVLEHLSNNGARTFGDAIEMVSHAGPEGQRQLLDLARRKMELESTITVDEARDAAAARRDDLPPPPSLASGPARDVEGYAAQRCHAPGCEAAPANEQGELVPSKAVRWFCSRHTDLAEPGDMDPWQGPQLRFGPAGLEVVLPEADIDFYREIDQQREDEDAERQRQRQEDEENVSRAYERWRENGMDDGTLEIAGLPPSRIAR
jgi:hypothetical protein